MEFRVLGPLEVRRDGRVIELRGSKRRAVLALLVLHANEVVRAERLIEEVWGEGRPASGAAALHNHVSRLRKDLGADVLVTKPWGYVLRTDPEAIDLGRFERLVAEAKPLAAHERTALLAEALALWRGPALADLAHEPALAVESARLDELRLAALEQRIDSDLELGRHEELIPELEALVAQQPLRERLRGQLILALYRSGRQAEALETYRETRRVLVEELGIEPSAELRELERAILRQDPVLASVPPPPAEVEALDTASRWRWPRSPLAVAAGILVLAGLGATAAILTTRSGGASPVRRASPASRPAAFSQGSTIVKRPPVSQSSVGKRVTRHTPKQISSTERSVRSPAPAPRPARTAKHIARVAVPSKPKPARTSTQKAANSPPKVYWLADNFEDPAFDFLMWHIASNGLADSANGVEVAEPNGRLEFSVDPGVALTGPGFDKHYGTQCRLLGDFDGRVDFKLLRWPSGDGISLTLGAYFPGHFAPQDFMSIARLGEGANGGFESYFTSVRSDNHSVQTSDTDGGLRIRRVNGVLSTYYRYRQRWVRLGSGIAPHPAHLILSFGSNTDQFGQEAAVAAFDNFQTSADGVDCKGFPLPPLKPRS